MSAAPPAGTVLVTGVHREELAFGDRVSAELESAIDVLRIPEGVPQRCPDVDQQFYYDTRQRELYLQLHQQVKGRYRLLIDLHTGFDESEISADVYCHDPSLLDRLASRLREAGCADRVRLIRIVAPGEPVAGGRQGSGVNAGAHARIPHIVWSGCSPVYVGLELYLSEDQPGGFEAEQLARTLIACLRNCEVES